MANEENLIPLNKRSKEQAKKIQKAGGIARGKQRAEEKSFRELLKLALNEYLDKKHRGKEITVQEGIILKALQQALNGDAKAREWLTKILGEYSDNINLTGEVNVQKVFVTEKDKKDIDSKIDELLNDK